MIAQTTFDGPGLGPILALLVLLLLVLPAISYNRFVTQRNLVRESFSDIDTELLRRHDLIDNLVATVKGYAAHEREVLAKVAEARAATSIPGADPAREAAERALAGRARNLLAVAEGYPDLRASENFLELQRELAITEDRLQAARRFYNGNVRDLNRRVQSFPSMIIARMFGFTEAAFFEVEPVVREAPVVEP